MEGAFTAALAKAKAAGKRVFVGVKLDGDIEKALVKRYTVKGYPTMLVLDASGVEANRGVGYLSSKEVLALLNAKR